MPEDRPITPSAVTVDGVASKAAVKEPVCMGMLWDCHEAELRTQPGGVTVVLVRVKLAGVPAPETVAVTI